MSGDRFAAGSRVKSLARIPLEPLLVAGALFVVLVAFLAADPAGGQSGSVAPFTDEIGNTINARNFVQLGSWSDGNWNLYLVSLPYSLLTAIFFKLFGVGIVQARLVALICASLAAGILVWGLRPVLGRACATFAGLAFAFSGLIVFYARLAFLEDMVVLGLVAGFAALARDSWLGWRGGLWSGFWFALAAGTKPSALIATFGMLAGIGLVWRREAAVRRWLAGCVIAIAAAGLAWALVVGLPNRAAVSIDVNEIWPPYKWNVTPWDLARSVGGYLIRSDGVLGIKLLPLVAMAVAGLGAIVRWRKRLTTPQARLAVASFCWAAFGFGILMVASYRPNRYVVPLVPSLAILAAIGLRLAIDRLAARKAAGDAAREPGREPSSAGAPVVWPAGRLSGAVLAAAVAIAVVPGLGLQVSWMRDASYNMVAIQDDFASSVPAGQSASGNSSVPPLFLMRSGAFVYYPGMVDAGDLYSQGVRWYVTPPDWPAPPGVSADKWAAKEQIQCATWRDRQECLYHVP